MHHRAHRLSASHPPSYAAKRQAYQCAPRGAQRASRISRNRCCAAPTCNISGIGAPRGRQNNKCWHRILAKAHKHRNLNQPSSARARCRPRVKRAERFLLAAVKQHNTPAPAHHNIEEEASPAARGAWRLNKLKRSEQNQTSSKWYQPCSRAAGNVETASASACSTSHNTGVDGYGIFFVSEIAMSRREINGEEEIKARACDYHDNDKYHYRVIWAIWRSRPEVTH